MNADGMKLESATDADLLREDTENRERALTLESFLVEAPAGAGKTELLTQRFLRLLREVDEPEEIVALTFTNKAAGEMRERIEKSLRRARDDATPPEPAHERKTFELARAALARSAERGWQLETQPGRLRLMTIDALCASLARQMPLLTRFGAQPGLTENAQRHYAEAARRALAHLESAEHADAVATALDYLDNDVARLADLLAGMLARRDQWREAMSLADPEAAIDAAVREMIGETLTQVAAVLDESWQTQLMPLARFAAAQLGGGELSGTELSGLAGLAEWHAPLPTAADALPQWRALADFLLTQQGEPRKTVTVKNGFPAGKEFKPQKDAMLACLAALDAPMTEALRRLRELPQAEQTNAEVVRALAALMKLAAAELWLVFREQGEVDFGELALRAIDALGDELEPSELGLRLDYRIRHLLIDEFQDTSPLQIDLLKRLTAGWQAGDGRTLFAVGDPMQSIYRFRKAEVGLFLRAAQQGIGGVRLTPLRLSRNNRACPAMIDWINAHFPAVLPPTDDPVRGEIRYRPFVATREALPESGVFVHPLVLDAEIDDEAAARREAEMTIELIAVERRRDPQCRIAVLARARKHLSTLIAALRRRGVESPVERRAQWRFVAVDLEPLAERQVVRDLIALTRALHHRADRVHWLAILRAPWCGLTLADLLILAGDDHAATVWTLMRDDARLARLSADGQRRLRLVRDVLTEALAGQGRQPRRAWVEDVWRKLGGPACLTHENDMADAQAFFDRLAALDAAGRFAIDRLAEEMDGLFAAPDAAADGGLQLLTVHKSKGLEFDVVILPGLHRKTSGNATPLLAWDSVALADGERLLAAPVNPRREKSAPSLYDFIQQLEKRRQDNEEARVLYVAATRAKCRLHLLGTAFRKATDDGAMTLVPPAAATPLGRLWPVVMADFQAVAVDAATTIAARSNASSVTPLAEFVPPLLRLENPLACATWQAPATWPAAMPRDDAPGDALAAAVGTLVHACLEQIADHVAAWDVERLQTLQAAGERWLASRGWARAEAAGGAARAVAILRTALTSVDGQWVLHARAGAASELALTRREKVGAGETASDDVAKDAIGIERLVTRVVDRSFIDDGARWIIDYKTADLGAKADGADDAALSAHAERFRPQLEAYALLFAHENLPRRLAIFYVAHGRLITLKN